MTLNEPDARAVDMLLAVFYGLPGTSAAAGAAGGNLSDTLTSAGSLRSVPAGASSAVKAMSDEMANRVTHVDDLLKLLDYFPADEPPATLVQRTMQRIDETRVQGRITPAGAHLGAPPPARPAAGFGPGLARSPSAGGDEDPASS